MTFIRNLFLSLGIIAILTQPAFAETEKNLMQKDIIVAAKIFDDADCMKYLGRPIRNYGYQPIQLIIKNKSDKKIIFLLDQMNLPCEKVENIISAAHTSTVGRVLGYSALALFSSVWFVIPAVVDGIASYEANSALDADYFSKAFKNKTTIAPNTKMNGIIFVPISTNLESFEVTLFDSDSNQPICLPVSIYSS
jgi:hypothetical protein